MFFPSAQHYVPSQGSNPDEDEDEDDDKSFIKNINCSHKLNYLCYLHITGRSGEEHTNHEATAPLFSKDEDSP